MRLDMVVVVVLAAGLVWADWWWAMADGGIHLAAGKTIMTPWHRWQLGLLRQLMCRWWWWWCWIWWPVGLLITGLIPSIHLQVNVALGDVVYLMNGQKTFTQCCVTVFRGFEIGLTSFVFFGTNTWELSKWQTVHVSQGCLGWSCCLWLTQWRGFPHNSGNRSRTSHQ